MATQAQINAAAKMVRDELEAATKDHGVLQFSRQIAALALQAAEEVEGL